jgi:hypothetical protein
MGTRTACLASTATAERWGWLALAVACTKPSSETHVSPPDTAPHETEPQETAVPPALPFSVSAGPTPHTLVVAVTSSDRAELRCDGAEAIPGVPERLEASSEGPNPTLQIHGLLAETDYECSLVAGDATETFPWRTGRLPAEVTAFTWAVTDGAATARPAYVLFNAAPVDDARAPQILVAVDRAGGVRWHTVVPDVDMGIAIEPTADGRVWAGGGAHLLMPPTLLAADGSVVATIDCPLCNHDVEPVGEDVWAIDGFGAESACVVSFVGDEFAASRVCADEAPGVFPAPFPGVNSISIGQGDQAGLVVVGIATDPSVTAFSWPDATPLWRIGGAAPTLTGPTDDVFSYRVHDVNLAQGCGHEVCLLLYANRTEDVGSQIMMLGVDPSAGTWTVSAQWADPPWFAPVWGGAWPEEDGGWLVAIGQSADGATDPSVIVEVDPATGAVKWRLELEPMIGTYRARSADPCVFLSHAGLCSASGA